MQSQVPCVETCLWKVGNGVGRCAVHLLQGQLPEQLLFPERALQNAGLSLLLEGVRDGGKTTSSSTTHLPGKFL